MPKPVPAATQLTTPPAAAPAALPAPTIAVNSQGIAMTNADQAAANARAVNTGLTPDVVAANARRQAATAAMQAQPQPPLSSSLGASGGSASRLTGAPAAPTAPNWSTAPGATGPEAINPTAATRAVQIPASPTGGATIAPNTGPAFTQPATGGPRIDAAGNIDPADFARRTAAARAAPLQPPPVQAPAAAVAPETIAAAENVAGAVPRASAAERAGAAAGKVVRGAGRVTRLGASPVETTPGRLGLSKTAKGQGGGAAAMLASIGIGSGVQSLNRDTTAYRERLGMDTTGPRSTLGDVWARTAGTLSDFGAAIPDTLINLVNATGKTDIRPIASTFADRAADFKPNYATDAKGFFTPVSPDSVTGDKAQANDAWQRAQLKQEIAERQRALGENPTTTAAAPDGSAPALPSAAPAAQQQQPGTLPAAQQLTAVPQQAAGGAGAGGGAPVAGAAAAPTPFAEINGRVVSPDEIARLNNRNVVSSEAFTNVAPGVLHSEATGGGTLTQEQAVQRIIDQRNSAPSAAERLVGNAGGQAIIPGSESSGGGIGGAPQINNRASTINDLMGQIHTALQSGRRRTAKVLVDQLAAFDGASGKDAALAAGAGRGGATGKAPKTAIELAKEQAEASKAGSDAQVAQITAAEAQQMAKIRERLAVETDPAKRKELSKTLSSLSGKGGTSADKLMMVDVPVGSGLDAKTLKLPYDPETNSFRIPDGYAELTGLNGQPAAGRK